MRVRAIVTGLIVGASALIGVPVPAAAAPVAYADAVVTPNDPGYRQQWGLARTRTNEAWTVVRGNARVTVAVVDTGVSRVPDLAGRLLPGRDFVNNDNDASDDNGHGTMAAGVIAAAGNDRTGVAGVCWTCKILPVKVLDAKGGGGYDRIAAGIRYAADQHATIISLSLGGSDDSPLLRDAVSYAVAKGSLVIAAAGNRGTSTPHYPAALPDVIAVGGVTATGARYRWSNYGSWVDVTGPGCNLAQTRSGAVGDYCGTSSATPFVAGVAALLASTDPAPSVAEIRTALIATRVRSSGLVNVLSALRALPYAGDTTAPKLVMGATTAVARKRVQVSALAADQHGVAAVRLYVGGRLIATDTTAPYSLFWPTPARAGLVILELRAYDRSGNVTSVRRTVRVDRAGNVRTVNGKLGR
ncbi:MAG: S8 family serine peptidase [Actinoplanes sp.]